MDTEKKHHALLYLWDLRTIYIAELFELRSLRVAASSLLFGLEKPFTIEDAKTGRSVQTRSALVAADALVNVDCGSQIMAICFLDPFGRDLQALRAEMKDSVDGLLVNSCREMQQLESLQTIYQDVVPAAAAYELLTVGILPAVELGADSVDQRMVRVVEMIKQDPMSNMSNQALAEQVGMSESQLQRMFKQVVGIPVRRFRLWHRLFVTAGIMMSGKSLTDAALAAGFSDSPHFSRTFRSMVGMTPSFVFQRHSHILINAGGDR